MPTSTTASSGFTSGSGGATSLTFSHTSDTNPLYVFLSWFVAFGNIEPADLVTGITFNGVALERGGHSGVEGNTMEWWRLTTPTSGAHSLVITLSASRRVSAGVVNLTGWPSDLSDHTFAALGGSGVPPPSVTVDSALASEVISWIGFNDPTQDVTIPSGSTQLWNQEGMGSGSGSFGDQVSACSIDDGAAVSVTVSWAGSQPSEYFGVAALSFPPASTSRHNLLTGSTHTVDGSDNLIVGVGGSVDGDRNALFALVDGSPAASISGNGTLRVVAESIELEADTVEANGNPVATVTGSPSTGALAKFSGADTLTDITADDASDFLDGASDPFVRTSASGGGSSIRAITFVFDNGSSVVASSMKKVYIYVPYACTITAVTLLADQSGSTVLGLKKCAFGSFPGSLTSIVASAPPTLSSAQSSQDTTLTGWTTSVSAGDVLEASVASGTTVTSVFGSLKVTV